MAKRRARRDNGKSLTSPISPTTHRDPNKVARPLANLKKTCALPPASHGVRGWPRHYPRVRYRSAQASRPTSTCAPAVSMSADTRDGGFFRRHLETCPRLDCLWPCLPARQLNPEVGVEVGVKGILRCANTQHRDARIVRKGIKRLALAAAAGIVRAAHSSSGARRLLPGRCRSSEWRSCNARAGRARRGSRGRCADRTASRQARLSNEGK
jgi:hypothetical protein